MRLQSIQVAVPSEHEWQGQKVFTAIFKKPIPGPVMVRTFNLDGDRQGAPSIHGGETKAVYGYGWDAYEWWKSRYRPEQLQPGAFGENLTFSTLPEGKIHIGDIFSLGDCELQAIEPRFPCSRLALKFQDATILKTFLASRRPGVYFKVIREGEIREGDELRLKTADRYQLPILAIYEAKTQKMADPELLKNLLQHPKLTDEWREMCQSKLSKIAQS